MAPQRSLPLCDARMARSLAGDLGTAQHLPSPSLQVQKTTPRSGGGGCSFRTAQQDPEPPGAWTFGRLLPQGIIDFQRFLTSGIILAPWLHPSAGDTGGHFKASKVRERAVGPVPDVAACSVCLQGLLLCHNDTVKLRIGNGNQNVDIWHLSEKCHHRIEEEANWPGLQWLRGASGRSSPPWPQPLGLCDGVCATS